MRKTLLAGLIVFVFAALALAFGTDSGIQSIDRGASHLRIDGTGQIRVEPKTGKGTSFSQGTVNFTGATVSGLNGSAIDAGTISATRLPTALNSATFATGKTVALTDADSLTVASVIVPQRIEIVLGGLGASSASGDQVFVANRAYQVTAVRATWSHVGGGSAAATIEKLTGTTAPGSGTAILTGAFDLTSTANTVGSGTLSGTVGNLQLAAGDRLGVKLSGTLTALTGLNITVQLKAI